VANTVTELYDNAFIPTMMVILTVIALALATWAYWGERKK
jgi:hypothetical protein